MQEYKTIVNTVVLPTDKDITKCLRVVEYLPVASAALLGEAFFLKKAQEGFQITHSYICCFDSSTGTYYWKDMNMGRFGVGNVTDFRIATSNDGDQVTMCWKDPADETVGTDVATWNRTVVVVKEGSQPVSTKDGKTVTINSIRDRYAAFGDFTFYISEVLGRSAEDLAGKTIYVKLFPITDSEVVTINDANCKVFKYGVDTMSWALARELIQNGHGPSYFKVGDVIILPKHGDFGEMEVEVLSHDTETLADNTKKHSMTVGTMKLPSWSDGNGSGLVYDNNNIPYISNGTADGATVPHFEVVYLPSGATQKVEGGTGTVWNRDYGVAIRDGLKSKTSGIPVIIGSVWDGNGDSVEVYGSAYTRAGLQGTRGSYRVNVPFRTRLHVADDGKWGRKSSTASGPSELPCAVAGSVIMPYSASFSPDYAFMREVVEYSYTDDTNLITAVHNAFSGFNKGKDTSYKYAAEFLSGISGDLGYLKRAAAGAKENLAFAINPADPISDANGGASSVSRYSATYKYLVPCNSVLTRTIDTTNKKVTQTYLTPMRNAAFDLRAVYALLRDLREDGSAVTTDNIPMYAYGHYRRYQTNPNAQASSSNQGGLESVNVLEMAKDLIHVPTRDERYLPFKRYWKKVYITVDDYCTMYKVDSPTSPGNEVEFYLPGSDTYKNEYNKSPKYVYRVKKDTADARVAKYYRLFNAVYTIAETNGSQYNKSTLGGFVSYTYVGSGGTTNLTITKQTSGNWVSGTNYFEFIDGKFVQLRPKTEFTKIGFDYMITGTGNHKDSLRIQDQLYTANTAIKILNDTHRFDTDGWYREDRSHIADDDPKELQDTSIPNPTTASDLKDAYNMADETKQHFSVRVYGAPTDDVSETGYDVEEICEAPVTSYAEGDPVDNPSKVVNSGDIVNIFWQGANMLRSKFGNPTWASSNLRMYLNGPFDTSLNTPKPVGYKCDPDNPDLYWNYGLSPVQQFEYDHKLRKWVEMFNVNELWFNTDVSADPFIKEKYSINLHPSYIGKYVGEGIAANPTPVMAGTFIQRDLPNCNSTDTRAGGVTVDTSFPRQSFLHGFLDCKYKKTNDVNPVAGKGYYYRNAWGNYERLPDTDTWVTGGPYAHALYELNENYHNDLLDALDFLAGITPVVNTTKVYNKPGPVASGGYSEHYSFNVSLVKTTDLVWVASKEQILGKGSADKWVEANGQLWTKTNGVGNWGLKHMVKYNHHSAAAGYTDEVYMENDVVAGTRSSTLADAYSLTSVVWKNGSRSVDPSNSVDDRRPVTKRGYNLVMVIG